MSGMDICDEVAVIRELFSSLAGKRACKFIGSFASTAQWKLQFQHVTRREYGAVVRLLDLDKYESANAVERVTTHAFRDERRAAKLALLSGSLET